MEQHCENLMLLSTIFWSISPLVSVFGRQSIPSYHIFLWSISHHLTPLISWYVLTVPSTFISNDASSSLLIRMCSIDCLSGLRILLSFRNGVGKVVGLCAAALETAQSVSCKIFFWAYSPWWISAVSKTIVWSFLRSFVSQSWLPWSLLLRIDLACIFSTLVMFGQWEWLIFDSLLSCKTCQRRERLL